MYCFVHLLSIVFNQTWEFTLFVEFALQVVSITDALLQYCNNVIHI